MTRCLEKHHCPETRLEGITYSACTDYTESKALSSADIKRALAVKHDPSISMQEEREKWPDGNAYCIDITQRIDPDVDMREQARAGFGVIEKVKSAIKAPLRDISMNPIHQNTGFFVWDFREHDALLGEFKQFAKKLGGTEMEAHDYAAIEFPKPCDIPAGTYRGAVASIDVNPSWVRYHPEGKRNDVLNFKWDCNAGTFTSAISGKSTLKVERRPAASGKQTLVTMTVKPSQRSKEYPCVSETGFWFYNGKYDGDDNGLDCPK